MKRRKFVTLALKASIGVLVMSGKVLAQAGRNRSPKQGSSVNRNGSSRSGSAKTPSSRNTPGKTSPSPSPSRSSGRRSPSGRRSVQRRKTPSRRNRSRRRTRRVPRGRRRGRWRTHSFRRHRRWYRGRWVALVFIAVAAFSTPTTSHTYSSVTYYRVNPWYRKVMHEGEEGYVLSTAPVGHKENDLPAGSETVTVDGKTYHYADAAFWQAASGGGYVVVAPPVGAEVSSIPDEASPETESGVTLYQFDDLYLTKDTNSSGKAIYRVEPKPPEEEIDAIPSGSPSFIADQETYYYVNFAFYVEFKENGQTGYVNGEPEIGAQADRLPDEVVTVEEGGQTYYQFDTLFFEEVEDDNGDIFYEVVGSPDGSYEEVEN